MKRTLTLGFICCLFLLVGDSALAQTPGRHEEFVYRVHSTAGGLYAQASYPEGLRRLYLPANQPVVLQALEAQVFYWPITGFYKIDEPTVKEVRSGSLQILQDEQVLDSVRPQPVAFYRAINQPGGDRILVGKDVVLQEYGRYLRAAAAYRQALQDYQAQEEAYQQTLETYLDQAKERAAQSQKRQVPESEIPEPPTRPVVPSPPPFFVGEPLVAYVLDVPPGRYRGRLVASDGAVLPGSEREVISFAPRREGISYQIKPARKWTVESQSDEPAETIYLPQGMEEILYVNPLRSLEYRQQALQSLQNPQARGLRWDAWEWLASQEMADVRLQVRSSQGIAEVAKKAYYVEQLPGGRLGYDIVPWDPKLASEPTFRAFQIRAAAQSPLDLRLVSPQGETIEGSQREIRWVRTDSVRWLYAMAGLPALFALALTLARRIGQVAI